MSAAFFDTDIFAYAADNRTDQNDKRDIARGLISTRAFAVSTQVMLELYGVLIRKLRYPAPLAFNWVAGLKDEMVVYLDADDMLEGFMISRRFQISHYDAMIIRAAEKSGSDTLYSEDLSHGQTFGSVTVINPFLEQPDT